MASKFKDFPSSVTLSADGAKAFSEIMEKPLSDVQKKFVQKSKGLVQMYQRRWQQTDKP